MTKLDFQSEWTTLDWKISSGTFITLGKSTYVFQADLCQVGWSILKSLGSLRILLYLTFLCSTNGQQSLDINTCILQNIFSPLLEICASENKNFFQNSCYWQCTYSPKIVNVIRELYNKINDFFFFLRFNYLLERVTEKGKSRDTEREWEVETEGKRGRERKGGEERLLRICWLIAPSSFTKAKVSNPEPHQTLECDVNDLIPWVIFCCFSRAVSRELCQKRNSSNWNQHSKRMLLFQPLCHNFHAG